MTDRALTSFAIQDGGAVLAVGTSDGAAHVLRLSAGLAEMAQNEKQGVNAMFERETLRCGGQGSRRGFSLLTAAHARVSAGWPARVPLGGPSERARKGRVHQPGPRQGAATGRER